MGGTGFIGFETVKALVERGDTVYGLARSRASEFKLMELGALPIAGDVYTPETWLPTLPNIDYAINVLGFFNDGKPMRLSVDFSVRCREKYIKWAEVLIHIAKYKNVKAAVHVTGTTVYEPREVGWITEMTPFRYTLDGFNRIAWPATRLMADEKERGVPIIMAIAPNVVYGSVPNSSFQQVFVDPLRRNQMGVVGHGRNYIPTGHVEDVGRAVAFVTDKKFVGESFLIAGDDPVTQKEFLHAIARGLGKKSVMKLPKRLVSVLGGKAAAEFMSLSQRVDNSKLKKAGFVFKHPRFLEEIPAVMKDLEQARNATPGPRLRRGGLAPPIHGRDHSGKAFDLHARKRLTMLQFHRYVGCPVCHLHIHNFLQRSEAWKALGVDIVVIYYSTPDDVLNIGHFPVAGLPITFLSDVERNCYRRYGVGESLWGTLSLSAWREGIVALFRGHSFRHAFQLYGLGGLPADFLIDERGILQQVRYGKSIDDSLSVDGLLRWLNELVPRRERAMVAESIVTN
jgi:NAD dependent epimerase/dehydratase family enzyme/peroxiredoxin